MIVKALRNKDNGLISFAPFSLFSSLFSELSYTHGRRDGNKIAHSLTSLALITPNCTVWMENVPSRTLCFVQTDLSVL